MFGLGARRGGGDGFARRLRDYPPGPPPPGAPGALPTAAEADAALRAFLDARPARLEALAALLETDGIELPRTLEALHGLDDGAMRDLVGRLHRWAGERWPGSVPVAVPGRGRRRDRAARRAAARALRERWMAGGRAGEDAAFAVVADVALVVGELIRARRPTLDWGANLDPVDVADSMPDAGRIVLLGRWLPDASVSVSVDVEGVVAERLIDPEAVSQTVGNGWLELIEAAAWGGYEGAGVV